MKNLGIIPARYASTRFPGKPLAMIAGKTMIRRVYERASLSKGLSEVIVATDDHRIFDHVCEFGGKVVMTPSVLQSGTERCAFALEMPEIKESGEYGVVVNIQGDEPGLHPGQIDSLVECFRSPEIIIATLAKIIDSDEDLANPNVVKLVCDNSFKAIYFSRSVIPYLRNPGELPHHKQHNYLKHIGLYAFRPEVLRQLKHLGPSSLAFAESLEQLSWLQHSLPIHVVMTEHENQAVDCPEDIDKLNF